MLTHSGEVDLPPQQKPPRLWRFLSWLVDWSWERSYGIEVDQDGEVSGSGIMLRLESPFNHRMFMYRWIGHLRPEWMKAQYREDISEVLLASLLVRPVGPPIAGGTFQPIEITWAEDQVNTGKEGDK